MNPMTLKTPALCLALAALAGCGAAEQSLFEHACEHLGGTGGAVTAAVEASVDAPDVSAEHTPFDITLVSVAGGMGGTVSYDAGQTGDFAFLLSADVPLTLTSASGQAVAFETTEADACGAGTIGHLAELELGSYLLTFGPTDLTQVQLVTEAVEHDHSDE